MSKGNVFIISGPSGSGKDTIIVKLLEKMPELFFSISSITRDMREGEVQGEKYNFISKQAFEDLIKNDALLEYNCYVGNYYGTPKAPVEKAVNNGKNALIEVDVNGAANIRRALPNAKSIFIMPPSVEELRRRLNHRGTETQEVIERRMNAALGEMERANEYTYTVVNDNLETAVEEIIKIIKNA